MWLHRLYWSSVDTVLMCCAAIIHMEGSLLQETIQLKELLLVNLDLVQQQQELLAEKDRKLHSLQQENESVSSLTFSVLAC